MKRALDWLVTQWQWPYATAFAALFLAALAPVIAHAAGWAVALVYAQLPLYMLHQLEEHRGDAFRKFVNATIGKGREVLSPNATFVINSLGVWGVDLAALYLAVFINPGWGLMAIYLPLVNALGHAAQGIALRRYNPGLWSAVFGFVPIAGVSLWIVTKWSHPTPVMQATGLAVAIGVHALIIIHVKRVLR